MTKAMQVSVMMVKFEDVVLDKSLDFGQDQGLDAQGQGQDQGLEVQGQGRDQGLKFCTYGQPRTNAKDSITEKQCPYCHYPTNPVQSNV